MRKYRTNAGTVEEKLPGVNATVNPSEKVQIAMAGGADTLKDVQTILGQEGKRNFLKNQGAKHIVSFYMGEGGYTGPGSPAATSEDSGYDYGEGDWDPGPPSPLTGMSAGDPPGGAVSGGGVTPGKTHGFNVGSTFDKEGWAVTQPSFFSDRSKAQARSQALGSWNQQEVDLDLRPGTSSLAKNAVPTKMEARVAQAMRSAKPTTTKGITAPPGIDIDELVAQHNTTKMLGAEVTKASAAAIRGTIKNKLGDIPSNATFTNFAGRQAKAGRPLPTIDDLLPSAERAVASQTDANAIMGFLTGAQDKVKYDERAGRYDVFETFNPFNSLPAAVLTGGLSKGWQAGALFAGAAVDVAQGFKSYKDIAVDTAISSIPGRIGKVARYAQQGYNFLDEDPRSLPALPGTIDHTVGKALSSVKNALGLGTVSKGGAKASGSISGTKSGGNVPTFDTGGDSVTAAPATKARRIAAVNNSPSLLDGDGLSRNELRKRRPIRFA
jgi:hypothetical protein